MFSDAYGGLIASTSSVREGPPEHVPEVLLQCIWYDRLFKDEQLRAHDGRFLKIVSPGWWNRGEGPDFTGAQIEFNGRLFSGDVEIHTSHRDWTQHGHHIDARYNEVLLVVVLQNEAPENPPVTSSGKRIPTLSLAPYLEHDLRKMAVEVTIDDYPFNAQHVAGQCLLLSSARGVDAILNLVQLAGEWRMLQKARNFRERADVVGMDQALYEQVLAACGYSHFKHHFRAVARHLPYDRARQLARQDPMLLEAAFLQVAGLLPDSLPCGTTAVPHFARLRSLRRDFLPGLKSLPLEWRRVAVRPINNPERRLAGAALFMARSAPQGLAGTLENIWQSELSPLKRRQAFIALFPKNLGFWSAHCTWTGKVMAHGTAPLGTTRIRSLIGNVFVPVGLAIARQTRNRKMEETVRDFFLALPAEAENKITRDMAPRLLGHESTVRLNFCSQQGLLQIRQDWCEHNPACRNCSILNFLNQRA